MATAGRRVAVATGVMALAAGTLMAAPANASPTGEESAQDAYHCVTELTKLYYNGAELGWAHPGQGITVVADNPGDRFWATLWGGTGTAYQILKDHTGWCVKP